MGPTTTGRVIRHRGLDRGSTRWVMGSWVMGSRVMGLGDDCLGENCLGDDADGKGEGHGDDAMTRWSDDAMAGARTGRGGRGTDDDERSARRAGAGQAQCSTGGPVVMMV